ncbi:type II CAAX endopeptidase family protein [Halococcus saccharolyticus]|uniref:Abortive infection protein n=1 Tax=Halococcus saccharolyticus DSM 5350 TaxID=1227455 RepID=M0MDN2_9EURY|nr:type II CAAX endopeptidase family protein [Halococcus saccharolyticus]EMA42789.1 abortive infection protein [Halococcus saccharolyticus DSM 5350]
MNGSVASRTYRLGPIGAFVASRDVSSFFALTLVISWAGWVPVAAGVVDREPLVLGMTVIGVLGPPVAAAIVTWLVGDSLRAWVGPVLRWRVHPQWYLATLGIPFVLITATSVAAVALGAPIEQPDLVRQGPIYALPLIYTLDVISLSVLGGGQEELGWRGFALPRLLERFDAVMASLVIGAVWALWHLPLFMTAGVSQYGTPFVPYAINTLALSVVFTWLYRATERSVLLVVLFHASLNASTLLNPIQHVTNTLHWFEAAVTWALALGLVAIYGRELQSGEPG